MTNSIVRFKLGASADDSDLADIVIAAIAAPGVAQLVAEQLGLDSPTLLEKALKPGGPSHAGKSREEVAAASRQAEEQAVVVRERLVARLKEIKDGAEGARALQREAAESIGDEQAEANCVKIRRVLERSARTELRVAYRKLWTLGRHSAGNFAQMSADEKKQLTRLFRNEQQFFANLLQDIYHGTYRLDLDKRCEKYGKAANEAFEFGVLLADLSPDSYVQWNMGDREHHECEDCIQLATGGRWKNGIYRAVELAKRGLVPRCDKLKCWSECNCSLKRVDKPTAKPTGKPLSSIRLEGPSSSSFHGQGRENREVYVRGTKRTFWNWKNRKRK